MTPDPTPRDAAFAVMAVDILSNVLSRASIPSELGAYLTEEIREVAGGRCVLLIECLGGPAETGHRVVSVSPMRMRSWAESPTARTVYEAVHSVASGQVWRGEEPVEAARLLRREGFELSMVFPLCAGGFRVGALLVLGLPDEEHVKSVLSLLNSLSAIVALVLRSALLYERQDQLVRERTAELEAANEALQRDGQRIEVLLSRSEQSRRALLGLLEDEKLAERALRESERSVRGKLDAILSPDTDLGALELADVIDSETLQQLMDEFYRLTHIGIGIIDLKGRVLVGTGWQDICTKFHRISPESCRLCVESDLELSREVPVGAFKLYRCKNGMWDMATPITLGDKHLGNVFLGQFLFDDETPDYAAFREQARRYGFEEREYMAALDRVPRWSRETVNTAMSFYGVFAAMIGKLSYSNIKLANALEERKHADEALRESERRYRLVFENSPVSIWEEDFSAVRSRFDELRKEGIADIGTYFAQHPETVGQFAELAKIVDANRAALAMHAAETREELLADLVHTFTSESFDALRQELICLWNGGTEMTIDTVVKTLQGDPRSATVYFAVCPGYEETLSRVLVSLVDITDRKRAERELARVNRALRVLSDSNAALVRMTDEGALLNEVCRIAVEVGSSRMAWVGYVEHDEERTVRPVAHSGESYGYVESAMVSWENERGRGPGGTAIRTGRPSIFRALPTDAAFAPWRDAAIEGGYKSVAALPLMSEGQTLGALLIYAGEEDAFDSREVEILEKLAGDLAFGITALRTRERRRLAEEEIRRLNVELESRVEERTAELAEAVNELESFSYSVSHDLRAPLRAIDGFSNLLETQCAGDLDEEGRSLLQTIRRNAHRMGRLIDDLLRFSRSSRAELRKATIDMNALTGQILDDILPATERDRTEIRVANLPAAWGDGGLVRVVLQNLLLNALKYSAPRERRLIEVGSRVADDGPEYFVRDNGVGFDPRYAGKLFGVFQRLHSEAEFEGNGIGLALVKRIVTRHGGRVWAESAVDRGATFWFTLGGASLARGAE